MDIWAATVATRLGFLVGFLGRLATTGRLRLLGLLRILGIFRIYARNVAFQIARKRIATLSSWTTTIKSFPTPTPGRAG